MRCSGMIDVPVDEEVVGAVEVDAAEDVEGPPPVPVVYAELLEGVITCDD